MKIVCISDTHCDLKYISIPSEGEILLHAGDLTYSGNIKEISSELIHLGNLAKNFEKTYLISGNHDWLAQKNPTLMKQLCEDNKITYLCDNSDRYKNLLFYGSPWQPWFFDWAWNLPRGEALKQKWDLIPNDTDVLITHGPPFGYGDIVKRGRVDMEHVGCEDLLDALDRIKPKLHVFGHIHEGHGEYMHGDIRLVNASTCDGHYRHINSPIIVDLNV